MKWVGQRCHPAPANTAAMTFFSPWWASEVASCTPLSTRPVNDSRKASQKEAGPENAPPLLPNESARPALSRESRRR